MSNEAEILRLRDEVIGLRAQLDEADHRMAAARDECDEALRSANQVAGDLESIKVDLLQMTRERNALVELRVENTKLAKHIHDMHQSWTWRLGRILLLPIRALRRVKRMLLRS